MHDKSVSIIREPKFVRRKPQNVGCLDRRRKNLIDVHSVQIASQRTTTRAPALKAIEAVLGPVRSRKGAHGAEVRSIGPVVGVLGAALVTGAPFFWKAPCGFPASSEKVS